MFFIIYIHILFCSSRIKFMLDVLLAIKNNNMSKIPQYDPSRIEHLKKILRSFIHKGNNVTQFNVTLEDLLEGMKSSIYSIILKNIDVLFLNNKLILYIFIFF